jgi:hypothetical protein
MHPTRVGKVIREAVLGPDAPASGMLGGRSPGNIPLHGEAKDEHSLKFSTTELLLRIVGVTCISLTIFVIDAIRRQHDSFAITYGIFRLAFSFGLAMLLFTGGREARVVVPFLIHGLWVGLNTLNYAPIAWHLSLRSLTHKMKRARDAVLVTEEAAFGNSSENADRPISEVEETSDDEEIEETEESGDEEEVEVGTAEGSATGVSTTTGIRSPPGRLAANAASAIS